MKIAITTGTFHPEAGGPPTYLHRLGQELVSRGHDVRLLTFGEKSGHPYAHPVIRVTRTLPLALRLAVYTARAFGLATWADLIFASDYGLPAALVSRFVKRPLVLKVVADFTWETATRRGWIDPDTPVLAFQSDRGSLRATALAAVQIWYAEAADCVITPSAYVGTLVRRWTGHDPTVIHNAVDVARFAPGDRLAAKRALGLAGPVVLVVARLIPLKGIDELISALVGTAATLVVCGDGPDEGRLRDLTRAAGVRAVFAGRVPTERMPGYYQGADAFVLYSTVEGLSHALLEAMASGVPVIVSDRGGNVEVVRHEETGLVLSRDRPEELRLAIERLLADRGLAARLAASARRHVEQTFTWPRLVDQTLAVFEDALAHR